ncbi:MAG: hypothetical protein PVJ86_14760, partial [Phycisphaerales bacterium]
MNRDVLGVKKDLQRLCSVLCMILVAVAFVTNNAEAELPGASQPIGAAGVQEANSAAPETSLRLLSVEPTVLFVEQKGALLQVAKLTIENTSKATEASVDVKFGSEQRTAVIGEVKNGKATFQIHVPHIDKATPADFVLRADGKVQDSDKTTWRPSRHWKVFIVPITHHDLGYTDTIENVLHLYDEFYDNVLAFCEQTDDWPEESKYRYTVEGTWS